MEVIVSKKYKEELQSFIDRNRDKKTSEDHHPPETIAELYNFGLNLYKQIISLCTIGAAGNALSIIEELHGLMRKCYMVSDNNEDLCEMLSKKLNRECLFTSVSRMENPTIKEDGDNIIVYDLGVIKQ